MISFLEVTKEFGSQVCLSGISFRIDPGEFVFLLGPSGAGKTSIGKLLIHDYKLTKGEIQVGDFYLSNIKKQDIVALRKQVSVIFQDYKLLPDRTAYENIALALEIAGKTDEVIKKTVPELLKIVGLENKMDVFPKELSGGESQRVVIARALATDPAVIFADEPTGNLDKKTGMLIVELLEKINKHGTTVIMATHDEEIVSKLKKRAIKIEQGKIVEDTGAKPLKSE